MLVEWLEDLANKHQMCPAIELTEPELEFRFTTAGLLRVVFEFGARPMWAPYDGYMQDLFLEIDPSQTDLLGECEALRNQIDRFRKPIPK